MSLTKSRKEWMVNPDGSRGYEWNPQGPDLFEPSRLEKPGRILIRGDLFAEKEETIGQLLFAVKKMERHVFVAVTSASKELFRRKGLIPEKNFWLGVSYRGDEDMIRVFYLRMLNPGRRFVVFEKVEERVNLNLQNLDWIVLDPGPGEMVKSHVRKLVLQAKDLGIPVFITSGVDWKTPLREFPWRKKGGKN